MREVEYNETVSRCVRPLHRVCPGGRVRREEADISEGSSCKYYNETVCIKKETGTMHEMHDNMDYKEDCKLLEVKCT